MMLHCLRGGLGRVGLHCYRLFPSLTQQIHQGNPPMVSLTGMQVIA
jgi:hypothetical protein